MRTKLYLAIGVLALARCVLAQGLNPGTPAKEYIYLNGQIIAIENATPAPAPQVSVGGLNAGNAALGWE